MTRSWKADLRSCSSTPASSRSRSACATPPSPSLTRRRQSSFTISGARQRDVERHLDIVTYLQRPHESPVGLDSELALHDRQPASQMAVGHLKLEALRPSPAGDLKLAQDRQPSNRLDRIGLEADRLRSEHLLLDVALDLLPVGVGERLDAVPSLAHLERPRVGFEGDRGDAALRRRLDPRPPIGDLDDQIVARPLRAALATAVHLDPPIARTKLMGAGGERHRADHTRARGAPARAHWQQLPIDPIVCHVKVRARGAPARAHWQAQAPSRQLPAILALSQRRSPPEPP